MTLEEKLGQRFMGNFCGSSSVEDVMEGIEKYHSGGLQFSLVFERFVRGGDYKLCGVSENIPLAKVAERLYQIRNLALERIGIPVIIGVDYEGGLESCVAPRRQMTLMPAQMGIAAAGSLNFAYKSAQVGAKETKLLGINMFYGPSLDTNTNPLNPEIGSRSFSEDPKEVAKFGLEYIRAYKDEGIISTAKHFPGKGEGSLNAHLELETITLDKERLGNVEIYPFKKAIQAGVDAIMVAHCRFPALDEDSGLPASISKGIITGLLRSELGFEGLIIPDTMTMFAISKDYDVPVACSMCLEAGADMVFMKVDEYRDDVLREIKESVKKGRLPEERVNKSVARILSIKYKKGLFNRLEYDGEEIERTIGCQKHRGICEDISQKSVVLIKNRKALPLKLKLSEKLLIINPHSGRVVLANDSIFSDHMLKDSVTKRHKNVTELLTDENPTDDQIYEAEVLAKHCSVTIVGLYWPGNFPQQIELLTKITKPAKKSIAINVGAPYVVEDIIKTDAILCVFGLTPYTLEAAISIIFGEKEPGGRLPVTVSKEYHKGFGLSQLQWT